MSLSLPRLQQSASITDDNGNPSTSFHIWWDTFAAALEKAFNDLSTSVAAIAAAQAAAAAAQATANTANTNAAAAQTTANTGVTNAAAAQTTANTGVSDAATAQTTANTANTTANTANTTATAVKKTDKISGSWTEPGAVLTATDAGTDATITVAAHTRHWGDGTTTSVNSHTFTGKAYTTLYFIYYDDPNQNDTTPSYQITTNGNTAAHNSSANRVGLGPVTTPASGGAATEGGGTPPGGGYKIFDI